MGTVRGDADWRALASVVGLDDPALAAREGRLRHQDRIDRAVSDWIAGREADAAMTELQAAGVPAARMLRVADLPGFDYYRKRGLFRVEAHPFLREDVVAERWAAKRAGAPEAPDGPAPLMGEQSEEVVAEWLGGRVDPAPLVTAGVLEPTEADTWAEARAGARADPPAPRAAAE